MLHHWRNAEGLSVSAGRTRARTNLDRFAIGSCESGQSRWSQLLLVGPDEAGRYRGASTGRTSLSGAELRREKSAEDAWLPSKNSHHRQLSFAGRSRFQRSARPLDAAGRGGFCFVNRKRECSKSAA